MLFSLILILVIYLPFQVALNPASGVDLASIRVIILGLFFLWLANGLRLKKVRLSAGFQTGCVITFIFLSAFSSFFARNSDWSIRKILFLLSVFPVYFIVSDIVNTTPKFRKISAGLVVSGALAAWVGILQFALQFFIGIDALYRFWANHVAVYFLGKTFTQSVLEHPSWLVNVSGRDYFRAISIFPDPHMFAFFLGLILPLAVALFFKNKKIFWLICAAIIFLADILTFSRGGYLGLFGGAAVLALIFQEKLTKKYKAGIFLGTVFLVISLAFPNPISSRFFSSFNPAEGSNAGRILMWKEAASGIVTSPLVGVGLGNFPLWVNPLSTYRDPIYAHNTYLDVAAESGIPAVLAWLGVLFFSIKAFLKKAKEEKLYLGAAISLVVFFIHSMTETGIYSPVVLTLVLIIAAASNIKEDCVKII